MDKRVYIDGEIHVLSDDQLKQARKQLGLRSDTQLLGATRLLEFDTGYGVVRQANKSSPPSKAPAVNASTA